MLRQQPLFTLQWGAHCIPVKNMLPLETRVSKLADSEVMEKRITDFQRDLLGVIIFGATHTSTIGFPDPCILSTGDTAPHYKGLGFCVYIGVWRMIPHHIEHDL